MRLTELAVLGSLSVLSPTEVRTVSQLCRDLGLTAGTARRALRGLLHDGFVSVTDQNPPTWRATSTGRGVMTNNVLREYVPSFVR